MAYRLSAGDEPVSRQLHQILLEQTDSAIAHLSKATAEDCDTAIHEARKDIKRIRALLRLMAHQLSKATFRAENHRFRDIGRRLSQLRDAQAIIESVTALPESALPARSRSTVVKRLQRQKSDLYRSLGVETVLASAVIDLQAARPALEVLAFKGFGYDAIEPGILSIYRRGRKALQTAQETCSPEDFHNLRKRVKDHGYQIRLFNAFNVEFLKLRQASVRDLETALGESHNLHVLRHTLQEGKLTEKVIAALASREAELNAEALAQAEGVYRLKTREFKRHLSGLHQLWAKRSAKDSTLPHKPPSQQVVAPATKKVPSEAIGA